MTQAIQPHDPAGRGTARHDRGRRLRTLIQRGKLDAERRSARKTRVSEAALARYIQAQQAAVRRFPEAAPADELALLWPRLEDATGTSPGWGG